MGQEQSSIKGKHFEVRPEQAGRGPIPPLSTRIEYEGILRLREIPFRNSVEISHNPPLFLENADTTLAQLLESRMGSTKLFTEEDILKLAESIIYTLNFLSSNKLCYPDLTTEHIFYDVQSGSFKLLPIQLIRERGYDLARSKKRFSLLAPELILAMRYGETQIDQDIMEKANVFTLGMVLLEVCTLKPSAECYDPSNYDILDEELMGRIQTVGEFYPQVVQKLIVQMLQYDYVQRPDTKKLSIELNRQINESRVVQKAPQTKNIPQTPVNAVYNQSNVQYKPPQQNLVKSQVKYIPKEETANFGYAPPLKSAYSMQHQNQHSHSPAKPKMQKAYSQPPPAPYYEQPYQNPYAYPIYGQESETPRYNMDYNDQSSTDMQTYQVNYGQYKVSKPVANYAPTYNPHTKSVTYAEQDYRSPIDETRNGRYQAPQPRQVHNYAKNYQVQNQKMPVVQPRHSVGQTAFKDLTQQPQVQPAYEKSPSKARRSEYVSPIQEEEMTDNSISRLKEEIEKSRKLIMEFQKMQSLTEPVESNKKYVPA